MKHITPLLLLASISLATGQTGTKTSDLSARPLQAGDKVIVATALGANAAGNVGDDVVALQAEDARTDNPHTVTATQVGLGNVDNTSDASKPVSTLQAAAIGVVQADVNAHEVRVDNPHAVTATQVGLGNVDNTSDVDKPVSTLQATAIGVVQADVDAHEVRVDNPHAVTATQVGLGNVDNTSDADKPVSTLQASANAAAKALAGVTYAADYGIVADAAYDGVGGTWSGTDNLAALQASVDAAVGLGSRTLQLPPGNILLDGTLVVGDTDGGFDALHLRGAAGSFLGSTTLVHSAAQNHNPMLDIAGVRSLRITDLRLRGNNLAPAQVNTETHRDSRLANWVSPGFSANRYSPYAGITFAALAGADPSTNSPAGPGYTYGAYGQTGLASKVQIERVRIEGFVAGIVVGPNSGVQGLEDIMIRDCSIIENTYGICTTGSQQRNVSVTNVNAQGSWCIFDNVTFGEQSGQPINRSFNNIGKSVYASQSSSGIGIANVIGEYFENMRCIGVFGGGASGARYPESYDGVNFSLIGHDDSNNQTQKDIPISSTKRVKFSNSAWVAKHLVLAFSDQPLTFENVGFRCETTDAQPTFGLYVRAGGFDSLLSLSGCFMRSYTGPTRYLNDEEVVQTLDSRALIGRNTRLIFEASTGKHYKVDRHPIPSRGPNISNIAYDTLDEISFDHTAAVDKPIAVGDLVYWPTRTPAVGDASGASISFPALRITDITGARVTCAVLADIDTTALPTAVEVFVQNFINSTEATGDIVSNSADITNVTNVGNFEVGDWLLTDDPGAYDRLRITGISGNTITCQRTILATATGVALFNSRLVEL